MRYAYTHTQVLNRHYTLKTQKCNDFTTKLKPVLRYSVVVLMVLLEIPFPHLDGLTLSLEAGDCCTVFSKFSCF